MNSSQQQQQNKDDLFLSQKPQHAWEHFIQSTQTFAPPLTTTSTTTTTSSSSNDNTTSTHPADATRFVLVSDTHGNHRNIQTIPSGDVLIHAGDMTRRGEYQSLRDIDAWFGELVGEGKGTATATSSSSSSFRHVLCIAGNHDLTLERHFLDHHWHRFYRKEPTREIACHGEWKWHPGVQYLRDQTANIENINNINNNNHHHHRPLEVYGSPWTSEFYAWAFNKPRGPPICEIWSKIPDTTDVLVTHGPPLGRGDVVFHGQQQHVGCLDLLRQVQQRIRPRLHVFGHIHEGHGVSFDGTTLFVNACSVDLHYNVVHDCIVVDVPHDRSQPARLVNG